MIRHWILAVACLVTVSCSADPIPKKWIEIGIPTDNIVQLGKETNENGFYADYNSISRRELWDSVSKALEAVGYSEVGSAFGGTVLGFVRGDDQLAMKIEQTGNLLHLSIFNSKGGGSAELLHGAVFGKYKLEKVDTIAPGREP